ncbi:MAG: sigma-70 family RNA polymerase sigma factor [Clostridia bacterium]|nr:sigma-70 family RNA polymerase sigma factor [Clostridia bacterium]
MNPSDFEQIYAAYNKKVMGYIMARVQRRAEAEDLCADVFEKVYRKIDDYNTEKAALNTWIYTITRNTLIDYFRKTKPTEEIDENIPADTAIDASLLKRETLGDLAKALRTLPREQQDIVVMLYYDRKPMTEIAEMMHLSYGMVKLRHQKALATLKKYLDA